MDINFLGAILLLGVLFLYYFLYYVAPILIIVMSTIFFIMISGSLANRDFRKLKKSLILLLITLTLLFTRIIFFKYLETSDRNHDTRIEQTTDIPTISQNSDTKNELENNDHEVTS